MQAVTKYFRKRFPARWISETPICILLSVGNDPEILNLAEAILSPFKNELVSVTVLITYLTFL
jgi:hypothetical protein